MGFIALLLTGVSLSMDAFAVSICKGLGMPKIRWTQALIIALFFGFFQAAMPVIGWFLGSSLAALIEPIDHWIAFALLVFVGAKMLWDAFHDDGDCKECGPENLDLRELFMLAIATSIDALAVGISLALLNVNIALAALVIGLTTFLLSLVGVVVGHKFGARFNRTATILGGVVLILIGLRILLEHLGVLGL